MTTQLNSITEKRALGKPIVLSTPSMDTPVPWYTLKSTFWDFAVTKQSARSQEEKQEISTLCSEGRQPLDLHRLTCMKWLGVSETDIIKWTMTANARNSNILSVSESELLSHPASCLPSICASTEGPKLQRPNMVGTTMTNKDFWLPELWASSHNGIINSLFPSYEALHLGSFSWPSCWPQDPPTHSCLCLPQRSPHKGPQHAVVCKLSVKNPLLKCEI